MNILSNAIKYTPEHGTISIAVTEKSSDIQGYGCYEFVISDTGIGMSPEFLKRIFEPFSREDIAIGKHYEGTGLGMAISLNLARMMQGRIDVESEKNKGSKFIVTIYLEHQTDNMDMDSDTKSGSNVETSTGTGSDNPIAGTNAGNNISTDAKTITDNTTPEGYTPIQADAMPFLQNKRILLVEDNELNMEIAENILAERGLIIEKAWNGKEACDIFLNSPAGHFDLIFMDIQMPVMNGYEATNTIRHSNRADAKSIPILAMTANAFVEDIQAAQNATMNEHIAKPLNPQLLFRALERWLS